jgi:hypothetical protein
VSVNLVAIGFWQPRSGASTLPTVADASSSTAAQMRRHRGGRLAELARRPVPGHVPQCTRTGPQKLHGLQLD